MPVSAEQIGRQLAALGVPRGAVLVVHCAFSRTGPVQGGPEGLIQALRAWLGPEGTLVMPSMTEDDDAVFDPARSHCRGMGVLADTFWRLPGVRRSDSPHAFAACGPLAEVITAAHPVDDPHGMDSPVGRVFAHAGHVLLLGVDHDANTTMHLAESLAKVAYGIPKYSTVRDGNAVRRIHYLEAQGCCARFVEVNAALQRRRAQSIGRLGHGTARHVRSRDVVDAALDLLRRDPEAFLHPAGECGECDAARDGSARSG
ncbi:AAC(3) family N-acetyltransferase [Arenimonas terrae]|jgi:aminoglycoside 3-N-acetyltransferase|uniref:Aminoglycoside N(3)-acetyltransferase n=1 Tax=Arenimonas terrae TaxID=2546226 RepID=A0A5C4RP30_9GAMM|nr:AAC(3) family N-acetyltransferase [Arenimonas terrae]TNJ32900.1 AAC(3) family N-acetyltransferase [Arenimonas terrae]